jgi:hypothetical protein
MHPVWEKVADAVVKDFDEPKARKESCTRRIPLLLLLAAVALAGVSAFVAWANMPERSGAYCVYPDPFGGAQ